MTDVLVIGAGAAGLAASMYACRAGLSCVLLEKMFSGGQVITTHEVENYPGFVEPVAGADLAMKLEAHARKYGVTIESVNIDGLEIIGKTKIAKSGSRTYEAKSVILAMGAVPKTLGLLNENKLRGKGVSYCATCDGAFYVGKKVAVVGGGNTAVEDALFLSRLCEKVYLIHRRAHLRADKILIDKVLSNDKIEVVWNSTVQMINGDSVESITIYDNFNEKRLTVDVDGVFMAIGVSPASQLVRGLLDMDEGGYIITDDEMRTSIDGVYAAGDVRSKKLRQIVTAVADGALAASMISRNFYAN